MKNYIKQTLAVSALSAFATTASAEGVSLFDDDKQLHIIAGATTYAGARALGATDGQAFITCGAVAIAKEARDSTGRGQVELADAVATVLPCAVAYLIASRNADQTTRITDHSEPISDAQRRDLIAFGQSLTP